MLKLRIALFIFLILCPAIAQAVEFTRPIIVDTIQILKISSQDQRAIIKKADGRLKVIKVGDVVPMQEAGDSKQKTEGKATLKVIEIVKDRVVLEEKKGDAIEKVIIRLVDGKQKVERMKKTAEKAPVLYAPQKMQTQTSDAKNKKRDRVNSFN